MNLILYYTWGLNFAGLSPCVKATFMPNVQGAYGIVVLFPRKETGQMTVICCQALLINGLLVAHITVLAEGSVTLVAVDGSELAQRRCVCWCGGDRDTWDVLLLVLQVSTVTICPPWRVLPLLVWCCPSFRWLGMETLQSRPWLAIWCLKPRTQTQCRPRLNNADPDSTMQTQQHRPRPSSADPDPTIQTQTQQSRPRPNNPDWTIQTQT